MRRAFWQAEGDEVRTSDGTSIVFTSCSFGDTDKRTVCSNGSGKKYSQTIPGIIGIVL